MQEPNQEQAKYEYRNRFYDSNEFFLSVSFQKGEKATTDGAAGETELKEMDPIEKAEKDFWKIIEEEKRKRDRKNVLVRLFLLDILPNSNHSLSFRETKKLPMVAMPIPREPPLIKIFLDVFLFFILFISYFTFSFTTDKKPHSIRI